LHFDFNEAIAALTLDLLHFNPGMGTAGATALESGKVVVAQ